MATATVTISNVRLEGSNATVPGSVVGSDPWNDASTGTYTENTLSSYTAPGSLDELEEAVADLSLPVDVATLNSITLEADLTATNAGAEGTGVQLHKAYVSLHDPALGEMAFFTGSPRELAGDGMETVTTNTTSLGSDPADLTTYLLPALNGGTIRVSRFSNADAGIPVDYTIRTHRLVLTIDYEPAAPTTTTPVTRLWPRDDALGNGSAPRIVPAPRGGRVVGGYN